MASGWCSTRPVRAVPLCVPFLDLCGPCMLPHPCPQRDMVAAAGAPAGLLRLLMQAERPDTQVGACVEQCRTARRRLLAPQLGPDPCRAAKACAHIIAVIEVYAGCHQVANVGHVLPQR